MNFGELMTIVWTVIKEKTKHEQSEIKKILKTELNDSLNKCFTGRMTRLLNSLNGFDDRVNIKISDSLEISNIIILIRNKPNYTNYENDEQIKSLLKEEIKKELSERGYIDDEIEIWLRYLDEV